MEDAVEELAQKIYKKRLALSVEEPAAKKPKTVEAALWIWLPRNSPEQDHQPLLIPSAGEDVDEEPILEFPKGAVGRWHILWRTYADYQKGEDEKDALRRLYNEMDANYAGASAFKRYQKKK